MEAGLNTPKKIGKMLRILRKNAGYTSYETFANEYELSRRHYWAAENGDSITISYFLQILAIHNISVYEFFKLMYATFEIPNELK